MNLKSLATALRDIGVDDRLVTLGEKAEFCWCLVQAEDGAWEVFWWERGNKNQLTRLASESDACTFLLGRLTYSQLLAGALTLNR